MEWKVPGIRQAGAKEEKINFVICSAKQITKGVEASEKLISKTCAKKTSN